MPDCNNSQQHWQHNHQLLSASLPSSLWLFLHKPPSKLLNENTGSARNNWKERQQPKWGRQRKRTQKEKRERQQSLRAHHEQIPPRQNLHACQQNTGNQLCQKTHRQAPNVEQQEHHVPQMVPPEVFFNNYKQKESHMKVDAIPAENLISMKNWMKLCHSNNN